MNIVTLRNVGLYEIPDSYKGILRISPNNNDDDPTAILTNRNNVIKLSDSEGHELPLSFKVKSVYSTVVNQADMIDLIQLEHHYKNLYITNNLYIKSNLFINVSDKKPPLLFINYDKESLGYPIESPYDSEYYNKDNILGFSPVLTYEENVKNIPYNHEIYDVTNSVNLKHYEKINDSYLLHTVQQNLGFKSVPVLKRRNYILGSYPTGRYKVNSSSPHKLNTISDITLKNHTQLAFIPLDKIIYRALESTITGLHRSYAGRYYNLQPVGNDESSKDALGELLFGKISEKFETIKQNSPILGIGVQTGTIHYNAIPAKRYLFHCLRRYPLEGRFKYFENNTNTLSEANPDINCVMNTLTKQYVLCDGKNIATDYPNIDKKSFNLNWSDTHSAIRDSINSSESTEKNFLTPPLFECNQLSLRFLRGLNWIRTKTSNGVNEDISNDVVYNKKGLPIDAQSTDILGFRSNTNKYVYPNIGNQEDDANHTKSINKVGMYYVNHDSKVQKRFDHCHLLFAKENGEINNVSESDSLATEKELFFGKHGQLLPSKTEEWKTYVNSKKSSDTFLNSHMLKTAGGLLVTGKQNFSEEDIKILQDQPISRIGGSNDIFHVVYAQSRHKRKFLGECTAAFGAAKHQGSTTASIKNGRYNLAHTDGEGSWRFLSSLPIENKYGQQSSLTNNYSTTLFGSTKVNLDDSLSSPPSVNFIPLMKI